MIEGIVKDTAGVPVAGAKGYVYVDGILATGTQLVDDAGVNLSNPLTTDSLGHYKAHVTFAIEYAIKWNWLGRERYIEVHRSDAGVAASAANAATSAGAAATSAATAAAYTNAKTANTAALIAAANINGFFPEEAVRTAVTAPNDIPTVAIGAANAASTINGRSYGNPLMLLTDTKFKWLAGASTYQAGVGSWRSRGAYYSGAQIASSDNLSNTLNQLLEQQSADAFDEKRLALISAWRASLNNENLFRQANARRPFLRVAALQRIVQTPEWDPRYAAIWSEIELSVGDARKVLFLRNIVQLARQGGKPNLAQVNPLLALLESSDIASRALSDFLLRQFYGGGPVYDPTWTDEANTRGIGLWRRFINATSAAR